LQKPRIASSSHATRGIAARRPDTRRCVLIESDHYKQQLRQVLDAFALTEIHVFSRCLECNTLLETVDKEAVFEKGSTFRLPDTGPLRGMSFVRSRFFGTVHTPTRCSLGLTYNSGALKTNRHTELIILLGALTAFAPMSIDMYLPALPTIGTAFSQHLVMCNSPSHRFSWAWLLDRRSTVR
jgi:hypothetical protein